MRYNLTCLTHQSYYSYRAKPCSVYLEVEYFCALIYYSVVCYDLDPCAQGQALRVFLSQKCCLPLFCQKYTFDFGSNLSESFIDKWHMTLLL